MGVGIAGSKLNKEADSISPFRPVLNWKRIGLLSAVSIPSSVS